MTQNEFCKFMGMRPEFCTTEEYVNANAVYEMPEVLAICHDSKEEFCAMWKEHLRDAFTKAIVKNALNAGTRIYEMTTEAEGLRKRGDMWKEANHSKFIKLHEKNVEIKNLKAKLEDRDAEIAAYKSNIKSTKDNTAYMNSQIASLKAEIDALKAENEDLSDSLAQSNTMIEEMENAQKAQTFAQTGCEQEGVRKVYVINREMTEDCGNGLKKYVTEEVARFNTLDMAGTMLEAMCKKSDYKTFVEFGNLDCIAAVRAKYIGRGEKHEYYISEEYLDENGNMIEFF